MMSLQDFDKSYRDRGAQGTLSPNAKVISMHPALSTTEESWKSALDARSDNPELDQILSALQEISNVVKSRALNTPSLDNALQRAASCARRQALIDREIRCLAVTDELTGLYNRRGFLTSASHQLKLAHRQGEDVLLLFCDVDNLKQINDSFGHYEGDQALVRAAAALKATFRDSDILARLGGDEFAVLASDASIPSRQAIVPRIEDSLKKAKAAQTRYNLSFSIGVARFDPQTPASLGELMARADQDMYVYKKSHRELRFSRRSQVR